MASEISKAIDQICEEKHIPRESVLEAIESALAVAYRKDFGNKMQNIEAEFDIDTGAVRTFDVKEVVEDPPEEPEEAEEAAEGEEEKEKPAPPETKAEAKTEGAGEEAPKPEDEKPEPEEDEVRFDPKTMIGVTAAQELKSGAGVGDIIRTELPVAGEFGRMAAQTAKQVIIQKLRESEREIQFTDFKGKEGAIVNGVVQRVEGRVVLVDLGNTTGVLPPQEQIRTERYSPGARVKVLVLSVNRTAKGPEITVSRAHPDMVRALFAMEVPEIQNGAIEIKAAAREAGVRTKVALISHEANIDPVGSCVGQRGTRVQTIISELGGEKIDIIEYDEDSVKFIINALSPAKVISVQLNEEARIATAEVKGDQLSLAIGKGGQNVRLAARLTGWKIDVVEEGKEKEEKKEEEAAEEKTDDVKAEETAEPKAEEQAPEEKTDEQS